MKKQTFIDYLINKSFYFFLITVVPIMGRLISHFLTIHYNDYLLSRLFIWSFTPMINTNINFYLILIMMNCAYATLIFIEYSFKAVNNKYNN